MSCPPARPGTWPCVPQTCLVPDLEGDKGPILSDAFCFAVRCFFSAVYQGEQRPLILRLLRTSVVPEARPRAGPWAFSCCWVCWRCRASGLWETLSVIFLVKSWCWVLLASRLAREGLLCVLLTTSTLLEPPARPPARPRPRLFSVRLCAPRTCADHHRRHTLPSARPPSPRCGPLVPGASAHPGRLLCGAAESRGLAHTRGLALAPPVVTLAEE